MPASIAENNLASANAALGSLVSADASSVHLLCDPHAAAATAGGLGPALVA